MVINISIKIYTIFGYAQAKAGTRGTFCRLTVTHGCQYKPSAQSCWRDRRELYHQHGLLSFRLQGLKWGNGKDKILRGDCEGEGGTEMGDSNRSVEMGRSRAKRRLLHQNNIIGLGSSVA